MKPNNNFAMQILLQADKTPDAIAFAGQKEITYKQLKHLAVSSALHMRKAGVRRSSCVVLDSADELVCTSLVLAVGLLGARWVQGSPTVSARRGELGLTHFFHTNPKRKSTQPGIQLVDASWARMPESVSGKKQLAFPLQASEADPWMYTQSSGTTGTPKISVDTYGAFWLRIAKYNKVSHSISPIVTSCIFPPLSIAWLAYTMRTLFLGGTVVQGMRLKRWHSYDLQKVFASPAQLIGLLERFDGTPPFRFPTAFATGGHLPEIDRQRLYALFDEIQVAYASTEAGQITGKVMRMNEEATSGAGWVPKDVDEGLAVEIVDPDGTVLPTGTEGIIRVRSEAMQSGYLNNPSLTARHFQEGWFYPGDIGYLAEDGELFVTGRSADLLNVRGVKINGAALDRRILSIEGVRDGIHFMADDPQQSEVLGCMLVLGEGATQNDILKSLKRLMQEDAKTRTLPIQVYFVDRVPRNPNGKAVRRKAAALSQDIISHTL